MSTCNILLFDYVSGNGHTKIWNNIINNHIPSMDRISVINDICAIYNCEYVRYNKEHIVITCATRLTHYAELKFNSEAEAVLFKLKYS
jgi:hypothetical protein